MPRTSTTDAPKSQLDKFKETAKQVETDNSEAAFDRALKRVAKPEKPTLKDQSK